MTKSMSINQTINSLKMSFLVLHVGLCRSDDGKHIAEKCSLNSLYRYLQMKGKFIFVYKKKKRTGGQKKAEKKSVEKLSKSNKIR